MFLAYALAFAILSPKALATESTAAALFQRLLDAGARTKAEVLAALPGEMKRNFVLVKDSRSRQRGTPELPRVIHFSKSADLMVSSSGHNADEDAAANDLEVMELNRATGAWRMATIHFEDGKISPPEYNRRNCLACHGENPRPIWGDYGNWPTVYGGMNGLETMAGEESAQYREFTDFAKVTDGYRHLEIPPGPAFRLTGTTFELPNSTLTARIGARQAEAVFARMRSSPAYPELRLALLASSRRFCRENAAITERLSALYRQRLASDPAFTAKWEKKPAELAITKVFRLLGVDTYADLRLDRLPRVPDPQGTEESATQWNAGVDRLLSLVDFLVLKDVARTDSRLRALFPNALAHDEAFLGSDDLGRLDQAPTRDAYFLSLFPHVEDQLFSLPFKQAAACEIFATPEYGFI